MSFPSLLDLDAGQQKVLDLPFRGSHVITGSPGGGKTVMAVYRTWALALAGRDVVLLTRSNLLHQYIAQMSPLLTESPQVTTYHRWIRRFWHTGFDTDLPRTDEGDWSYDWPEIQRACIQRNIRSTAHLVIDEGQNLPIGFYHLCRLLGVGVSVFADENQRIGDDHSTLSEIRRTLRVDADPLVLHENRRNSREIAMLAAEFRGEVRGDVSMPARSGSRPVVTRTPSLDHLLAGISHYFSAHRDRSIGIICRSTVLLRTSRADSPASGSRSTPRPTPTTISTGRPSTSRAGPSGS